MIALENVSAAKKFRLDKLVSALEDQDYLLQSVIDNFPKCDEKKDLKIVKSLIMNLLSEIDGMYSVD
jgi:hypothetical protein